MNRRHLPARVLVVAALVFPLSFSEGVNAASGRCTKVGNVRTIKGIKQVCTATGKTLSWKTSPKGTSAPSTIRRPVVPAAPVLSHPPIDSEGLDCDSGLPMVTARYYCFSSFADRVLESPGRLKWLPHYTYRLRPNAKIYAAMDGTIKRIITQEPDDLEFWLDNGDDVWMLVYDHVATMRVAEGAKVKAGDWIATSLNEITHRFEFQVNKDTRRIDNTSWHICPRTLGTASFNSFHESVLASNNARATDGGFASLCMAENVDPENLYGS